MGREGIQPRIAIIGAGGSVFPLVLIRDILSFASLREAAIRLFDIDHAAAEEIEDAVRSLATQHSLKVDIATCRDRVGALRRADFVLCTFQVGGLEAYRLDVEIPRRYGIDQVAGDTLGPGGLFRALRTVPALCELADDMRRQCPDALLIQYANPLSVNCWVTTELGIRTIGFCHSVQRTSRMLADEVGVPYDDVVFDCAGINHTSWFTTFRQGNRDLLPIIRQTMIERHLAKGATGGRGSHANLHEGRNERVRTELMRLTGYFHTESSHHASEYWPWFRRNNESIDRYFDERWDYLSLQAARAASNRRAEVLPGELKPGDEYAAPLIDSLLTGTSRVVYGNVRNAGLIANLPHDACVEVACVADGAGVRPVRFGALPLACAALNALQINVQRLVVTAGLSGSRSLAHAAAALDPLTGSVLGLPEIREMTEELFAAQSNWLPQFESRN